VRLYGHWQTLRAGRIRWIEGKLNITMRIIAGLAGIAALWTYLIWPEGILWALVPLPDSIRWLGVAAGAIGVAMLAWVAPRARPQFRREPAYSHRRPSPSDLRPISLGAQSHVHLPLHHSYFVLSCVSELGNRTRVAHWIYRADDFARPQRRSAYGTKVWRRIPRLG